MGPPKKYDVVQPEDIERRGKKAIDIIYFERTKNPSPDQNGRRSPQCSW